MSIRIEQYDGAEVLYVALDPDGVWHRSEFPDEVVTVDYNRQGTPIGVEVVGSAAKRVAETILGPLTDPGVVANPEAVEAALATT